MSYENPAEMPSWIRERFPANQRAAVDFLRPLIDEGMLAGIAAGDYGRDMEEHLKALKPIWHGAELKELGWFPREVLELEKWSDCSAAASEPDAFFLVRHTMRAFSCAVLLAEPNSEPEKETLIQMLNSMFVIGDEAAEATGRFLVWCMESLGRDGERPFFAVGIAAILQLLDRPLPTDREEELADWIAWEESSERERQLGFSRHYGKAAWLFGLSYSEMRNAQWMALIKKMQDESNGGPLAKLFSRHVHE